MASTPPGKPDYVFPKGDRDEEALKYLGWRRPTGKEAIGSDISYSESVIDEKGRKRPWSDVKYELERRRKKEAQQRAAKKALMK